MKKLPSYFSGVALVAACALPVSLTAEIVTVFAAGIDPNNSASYNNVWQGYRPTCWAASGSNVIGHWQKYHAPASAAPSGAQDVYNTFLSIYKVHTGGHSDILFRWWLGYHHSASVSGTMPVEPYFSTCGGYYESVYSKEEVRDIAWSYREVFTDTSSERFYDTQLSRAIYYALCNGYSMVIDIPNDQHAITLYGATFDTETNLLTSAYVCDSSGASFSASSMSHVRVGVREDIYGDSRLTLLGYYDENNDLSGYDSRKYLGNVNFLGNSALATKDFVFAIPEPSAFSLFAGFGILTFITLRRRKKAFPRN